MSVIIPTLNRPQLLAEALESLERQTLPDWEAIVVDDGSKPAVDVDSLIARFGPRIRGFSHETPRGGAAAKNTGVRHSRGEILAFLDDDDLYQPENIERVVGVLDRYPEIQVVYVGVAWFGANAEWANQDTLSSLKKTLDEAFGQQIEDELIAFDDRLLGALLHRVPVAFQREVVRRAAFEQVGPFREGRVLDHSDWSLRAACVLPVALLKTELYLARADGQSYVSRGDRLIDQLLANVDTKEMLLKRAEAGGASDERLLMLREAVAKCWFDVAYGYAERGNAGKSLKAWRTSQRHAFKLARMKFPVRVALQWVKTRHRPAAG